MPIWSRGQSLQSLYYTLNSPFIIPMRSYPLKICILVIELPISICFGVRSLWMCLSDFSVPVNLFAVFLRAFQKHLPPNSAPGDWVHICFSSKHRSHRNHIITAQAPQYLMDLYAHTAIFYDTCMSMVHLCCVNCVCAIFEATRSMLLAFLCNEENLCKKIAQWDSMVSSTVIGLFTWLQHALGLQMNSDAERRFYMVAR